MMQNRTGRATQPLLERHVLSSSAYNATTSCGRHVLETQQRVLGTSPCVRRAEQIHLQRLRAKSRSSPPIVPRSLSSCLRSTALSLTLLSVDLFFCSERMLSLVGSAARPNKRSTAASFSSKSLPFRPALVFFLCGFTHSRSCSTNRAAPGRAKLNAPVVAKSWRLCSSG